MILVLSLLLAEPDFALREREAMRQKVADERVRTGFLRREEGSILEGLATIDRALAEGRAKVRRLQTDELRLAASIDRAELSLERTRGELAHLYAELGRRAHSMRRLKKTPVGDLVARAPRTDARRLRVALERVVRHDLGLVERASAAARTEAELIEEMRRDRAALLAAEVETRAALESHEERQADRRALLRALSAERRLSERVVREISSAARKIEREGAMIRGLIPPPPRLPGGFAKQRGRLPWPVVGAVEVPFGQRVGLESGAVLAHRGLDVRAPYGAVVSAVFDGVVAFADRVAGLGNVVILDHESRWYSVYANLGALSVLRGERVEARAELGALGDEDSDKGAYLYFELRSERTAVDPAPWLAP